MTQPHHASGKNLCVIAMYAEAGCMVVGDGPSGWCATVDELEGNGLGVQE